MFRENASPPEPTPPPPFELIDEQLQLHPVDTDGLQDAIFEIANISDMHISLPYLWDPPEGAVNFRNEQFEWLRGRRAQIRHSFDYNTGMWIPEFFYSAFTYGTSPMEEGPG